MPLGDTALDGDWCATCIAEEPPFDRIHAVVRYTAQSAGIVIRLKYSRRTGYARLVARQMVRYVPEERVGWLLMPVPLHASRLRQRGFNQSLLIARQLAGMTGLPVKAHGLQRHKATRPLKGLNAAQRDREVRSVFRISSDARPQIKGRNILLVDDVLTTGATARACARQLKRAGAAEVHILCWARVVPDRDMLDLSAPDSDIGLAHLSRPETKYAQS